MKEIENNDIDLSELNKSLAMQVNDDMVDEYDKVLKDTDFLNEVSIDEAEIIDNFVIDMDGIFDDENEDKDIPKEDIDEEEIDENDEDSSIDDKDSDSDESDDAYSNEDDDDIDDYDDDIDDYDDEDEEADDDDDDDDDDDGDDGGNGGKKRKFPIWARALIAVVLVTCVISVPVIFLSMHLGLINYSDFSDTKEQQEEFDIDDKESTKNPKATDINASDIDWGETLHGSSRYDENVINVLMIGVDEKSTATYRNRSDTIIVLSINKSDKSVKMSSFMRDLYVPIPGHSDNKINSAYQTGGVPLLKQTLEEDFKITIDYSVYVHFDTFITIIDLIGGLDIEINQKEAAFINKKAKTTNLVEGINHMNGTQALWFSRIRKITSDIYGHDDFGRTCRQRTVINTIFKKYKDLSYTEMIDVIDKVLPYITTDMKTDDIIKCGALVLSYGLDEFQQFRVPIDNGYEEVNIHIPGYSKPLSAIGIDKFYKENLDALHMFIYGNTNY